MATEPTHHDAETLRKVRAALLAVGIDEHAALSAIASIQSAGVYFREKPPTFADSLESPFEVSEHSRVIAETIRKLADRDAEQRAMLPAAPAGYHWISEIQSDPVTEYAGSNDSRMTFKLVYKLREIPGFPEGV